MHIEITASSLDDIVNYLDQQVIARQQSASSAIRKALKRELLAEARGIKECADLLRHTKLVS